MISRFDFNEVIRDRLNNLYDSAALESHPAVFSAIPIPSGFTGNKGDYIRKIFEDAIEELQPARKEMVITSSEWRPYLILKKRYVDGIGIQVLSEELAISQRQMRRDHHKALETLSDILWRNLHQDNIAEEGNLQSALLEVHNEMVDPVETIRGVYALLKRQFDNKGIDVIFPTDQQYAPVITDRVILRQILISLMNDILHNQVEQAVTIACNIIDHEVQIKFSSSVIGKWEPGSEDGNEEDLTTVHYWCERIHARLEESYITERDQGFVNRVLWLPHSEQKILLVIDDQDAVVNLFKRYLSQTDILPIGINHPEQAVSLARLLLPAIITLDVMMPQMDGWELLQTIKLDEMLKHIPVIVCSAWDDPDLSQSLGAAVYLKKPVTQKMLLEAVEKVIHR